MIRTLRPKCGCVILIPLLSVTFWTAGVVMLDRKQGWAVEAETQRAPGEAREFRGLLFRLPGTGWRDAPSRTEARQLFFRKYGDQRSHYVAVGFVPVPHGLSNLTREEHASGYFDQERRELLGRGYGQGYTEGERTVGGRMFQTMAGRSRDQITGISMIDHIFVLYFPEDFQRRQGFYVLHWMDFHPPHAAPSALDDLDALLSSLTTREPS